LNTSWLKGENDRSSRQVRRRRVEAVASIKQRIFETRPSLLSVGGVAVVQAACGLIMASREQDCSTCCGGHYPQISPDWSTLPCRIIPHGDRSELPDVKLLVHGSRRRRSRIVILICRRNKVECPPAA
jgi:hypothetical protein